MRGVAILFVFLFGCGARSDLDRGGEGGAPTPRGGIDSGVVLPPDDPRSPDGSERCNGLDDDGDGRIDEGIVLRCGRGACFATTECEGGVLRACAPLPPGDEICNEVDDDCDGVVDEHLGGSVLSDAVVVRATDEGDSGDCRVCRRAFSPSVMQTDEGMLAVWPLDFLFGRRRPNTFVRRLRSDGESLEAVRVLTARNTTFGVRAAPLRRDRTLLAFCERFDDGTDHPAAALIDGAGELRSAITVFDSEERCQPRRPPSVWWTGERYLVFWGSASERVYRIESLDEEGLHLESRDVALEGTVYEFLPDGERALAVVGGSTYFVSPDGELSAPVPFPFGARGVVIVPRAGGYLAFLERVMPRPDFLEEVRVSVLSLDEQGRAVGGERTLDLRGNAELFGGARRGEGALIALGVSADPLTGLGGGTRVLELDDDAEVVTEWSIPASEEGRWHDVRFLDNGGQTVMIYVVDAVSRLVNEVHLRRFGCDPDV